MAPKRNRDQEQSSPSNERPGAKGTASDGATRVQPTRRPNADRDAEMVAANIARRAFVAALIGRGASAPMVQFAREDMAAYPDGETPLAEEVVAQLTYRPHTPIDDAPGPVARWPGSTGRADDRLSNVLFAVVACTIESSWSERAWRTHDPRRLRYLQLLVDHGYAPSAIERRMAKAPASRGAAKRASTGGA